MTRGGKLATARVVFKSPGRQINGLQATPAGLWACDQVDNKVYLLGYDDGSALPSCLRLASRARASRRGTWPASPGARGLSRLRRACRKARVFACGPTGNTVESK